MYSLIIFVSVIFVRQEHFSTRLHNSENYRGTTALHYAVLAHRPEVVRVLIANGTFFHHQICRSHNCFDFRRWSNVGKRGWSLTHRLRFRWRNPADVTGVFDEGASRLSFFDCAIDCYFSLRKRRSDAKSKRDVVFRWKNVWSNPSLVKKAPFVTLLLVKIFLFLLIVTKLFGSSNSPSRDGMVRRRASTRILIFGFEWHWQNRIGQTSRFIFQQRREARFHTHRHERISAKARGQ